MPPADDQLNVNPSVPQQGDAPQSMPPASDGGQQQPLQPQVFSPTVSPSNDVAVPEEPAAAPGFSSMPDGNGSAVPGDVPAAPAYSDPQSAPAPAAPGEVPSANAQYQDPGDVPVFPPSDDDDTVPPAAI